MLKSIKNTSTKLNWSISTVLLIFLFVGAGLPQSPFAEDVPPVDSTDLDYRIRFTEPVNISKTPVGISQYPAFAVDTEGTINVAWEETLMEALMYSRSNDSGNAFTEPVSLFSGSVLETAAASSTDNTIHISFSAHIYNTDIFYQRSTDGVNFSLMLISEFDHFFSYISSIASDNRTVAVTWTDDNLYDNTTRIVVRSSVDGGLTFTAPKIMKTDGRPVQCSKVAIWDTRSIFVAWMDTFSPDHRPDIFFSKSEDAGLSFSTPINISNLLEKSWCPRIAVDGGGTIYIVWEEGEVFDRKILIARSFDGGETFDAPRLLSVNVADADCPAMAVDFDGRVYVTWSIGDFGEHTGQTYLRISSDRGESFSNILRMTNMSGASVCPEIISNNDLGLHTVWIDGWDPVFEERNRDIFYSHGSVTGPYAPFEWEIFMPAILHGARNKVMDSTE